jgi:anti-sigma factor RsiW
MKPIEERLWDYIDGHSSAEERIAIEQLLQTDPSVKQLHEEFLAISNSLKFSELEEPSLRFTKNVMEQVALEPAPKALHTRVDKRIINMISGFFLLTLSVLIVITLFQIDWKSGLGDFSFSVPPVDWTKYFSSWMVQAFLIGDVVLGLYMLDRWLQQRRQSRAAAR